MRRASRREKTSDKPATATWVFAGLVVLLVWLPVPWGSNAEVPRAVFGLVTALLFMGALATRRPDASNGLPAAAFVAILIWFLWLGWICVQLVPLPPGLLATLSPEAYGIHSEYAQLPGANPLFTLSIDPGKTVSGLIMSLNYFALFVVAMISVRRSRARQRILLGAIVFSGIFQALYGTLMVLSGWEHGFLGSKQHGIGVVTGTFINRNHLAGYLELALTAGIALILADLRPRTYHSVREYLRGLVDFMLSQRIQIRVLLAVMVIALVLTESRMGNIAFFSSLIAIGSVYMFLRHYQVFIRSLVFFASLLVVDLLIVSEYYGLDRLEQRLEKTDLETETRLQVYRELEPALVNFRWTGSGLGTFADTYSPHRTERVSRYVDHAHNDHFEFLIETGMIGYGLLAALGGLLFWHGLRIVVRRRDARACSLGFVGPMALACLAVHGIADFNLQIPAVAATLVVLMAMTFSCSADSARRQASRKQDEDPEGAGPATA